MSTTSFVLAPRPMERPSLFSPRTVGKGATTPPSSPQPATTATVNDNPGPSAMAPARQSAFLARTLRKA